MCRQNSPDPTRHGAYKTSESVLWYLVQTCDHQIGYVYHSQWHNWAVSLSYVWNNHRWLARSYRLLFRTLQHTSIICGVHGPMSGGYYKDERWTQTLVGGCLYYLGTLVYVTIIPLIRWQTVSFTGMTPQKTTFLRITLLRLCTFLCVWEDVGVIYQFKALFTWSMLMIQKCIYNHEANVLFSWWNWTNNQKFWYCRATVLKI